MNHFFRENKKIAKINRRVKNVNRNNLNFVSRVLQSAKMNRREI